MKKYLDMKKTNNKGGHVKMALLTIGLGSGFLGSGLVAQAQTNTETYESLLQQISDTKINILRQNMLVAEQKRKIRLVNSDLVNFEFTKKQFSDVLVQMTAAISKEIANDYPFLLEGNGGRLPRVRALQEAVKDDTISIGEKYRKAMTAYVFEVRYGQSIVAERGDHPLLERRVERLGDDRYEKEDNGEILTDKNGQPVLKYDGVYLRYGRVAMVYVNAGFSEPYRYDLEARQWVKMPSSSLSLLRRAVRMANGEVAPSVVMAPVLVNGG